jgi:hypothetical protein
MTESTTINVVPISGYYLAGMGWEKSGFTWKLNGNALTYDGVVWLLNGNKVEYTYELDKCTDTIL